MLPDHKWEIGVSAGSYYPGLTQDFWGNDLFLEFENDVMGMQFYAFSYHIDELDNEDDVACRLFSLETLLNGALRLSYSSSILAAPVRFTCFAMCDGGPRHEVYASNIEHDPFSHNPEIDRMECSSRPAKGRLPSRILNLCKQDVALRTLVFHVGLVSINSTLEKILAWNTLYKIYDSVNFHATTNNYDFAQMGDQKRIKQFTAACNNSLLLGVYARHGDQGWGQPKAAITDLNEAIDVILELARNFCRTHIAAKYP